MPGDDPDRCVRHRRDYQHHFAKATGAATLSAGRFEALYGFAGRLAHDLNNPLMIVAGYAEELMQAMKPSDPLRQEAGEILGAARRIGGIAAQLTEFARRQGKPASKVNIGDSILILRSKISAAAGERVAVELTANPEPVVAMADPGQLGEVSLPWSPARVRARLGNGRDRHRVGRRDRHRTPVSHRLGGGNTLASPFATMAMDWTRSKPPAYSIRCSEDGRSGFGPPRWLWRAPIA